jgi:ABC-type branched-subunit amino acid transport system substrate-binding protein
VKQADLFIGPFHRSAIEDLARVNRSAHIVCPVQQSNKVLLGHPNVSKTACSRADQIIELAHTAVAQHAMDRIILCRPEIPAETDFQDQVLRALQDALDHQTMRASDSVIVARPGRRDIADLQAKLDPVRTNAVVLPSEDVEVVATVLSKLAALNGKYSIVLYGLNAWLDMSNLDPAEMDKVNLHLPAPTWIDMNDPRVIQFVRAFRDRFHTEPDEYAFLGYDVSSFYLAALQQQGTGFAERYDRVISHPLHMGFDMTRTGVENGWRNERCVVLEVKEMGSRKVEVIGRDEQR